MVAVIPLAAVPDVNQLNEQIVHLIDEGQYAQALQLAQAALQEVETINGSKDLTTATALSNTARVYALLGLYDEALPLYTRALAIREGAFGAEHPTTATSLNDLAGLYGSMGRYDQAVMLYTRALKISEKTQGVEHLSTATILDNMAVLYHSIGLYDQALPLQTRALAIREKALGAEHLITALSLNDLGVLYRSMGRYDEALPLYTRALAIRERTLGAEHPEVAASLNNLAGLYEAMGRYESALPLYIRALAIKQKALGPEHPGTANSLYNLASLYRSMGHFDRALLPYERALQIREKSLGAEHPLTATSLAGLASLYFSMGRYDDALPLSARALAIREKALGTEHPDTAHSLNNLAVLYESMGRYDEALPLYTRALAIRQKTLGPLHPDTAYSLDNLAKLYLVVGRYDEALPLYSRALAIREQSLGAEHPDTARSLIDLASLYFTFGLYDKALPLYTRALAIQEKTLGRQHPEVAISLNGLAALNSAIGRKDEALPLYSRALSIREQALGAEHPDTAFSINNLAALYDSLGRYDKALPLYARALAIDEKALGAEHPETAAALNNLAELYKSMGRYDEALPLFRRAVRILSPTNTTDQAQVHGGIQDLAIYSANLGAFLAQHNGTASPDEAIYYYKLSINARQRMRIGARGLDASLRQSLTTKVEHPYHDLVQLLIQRGRLAEAEQVLLLLKESEFNAFLRRNGSTGEVKAEALGWTAEEQALNRDLAGIAKQWRELDGRRLLIHERVTRGELQMTSPEVQVLDNQRLQLEDRTQNVLEDANRRFTQASQQANARRQQAFENARTALSMKLDELKLRADGGLRTAGLLLLPSERGLTIIVTTDQGAVPLMREVSEAQLGEWVNDLRVALQTAKGDYKRPARLLYEHLIQPAEEQLKGAKDVEQWAILPFGVLSDVPFAALIQADGKHLIERYAVTVLTADGTARLEGLETEPRDSWEGVALGASQGDPEFDNLPLAGVQREVCGIVRGHAEAACNEDDGVIAGDRFLDASFTEGVLKQLMGRSTSGRNFLHIATHFKLENGKLQMGDRSKVSIHTIEAWRPSMGKYDLVVLSACDTGRSNGGVGSLGGVFRSAGAKSVLATLWPVADVGAAPLMVDFYRQRGEKRKMSKSAALRWAQLGLLSGRIKGQAGYEDLSHPHYWAPYVLMGNWL
ncbi:tetratricopeptide repeat protein [Variovorax sp. dw_954]|uniref:tetratricopeptide repeat protein n=3 Tax=unclassified Variovorax TaxID=663243 RepID=UPI001BD40513|nr:tetratricopeptide repeat protein [Variovorax sp. dw_954]